MYNGRRKCQRRATAKQRAMIETSLPLRTVTITITESNGPGLGGYNISNNITVEALYFLPFSSFYYLSRTIADYIRFSPYRKAGCRKGIYCLFIVSLLFFFLKLTYLNEQM